MRTRICIKTGCLAVAVLCAAVAGSDKSTQSHEVQAHALPRLDGAHLQVHLVEVTYGPGGQSPIHSHPCAVTGYVIEGAVRMQTEGAAEAVYKAGQGFYEAPNSVHLVSANASAKKPAKFIAYFVCDRETPLTVPAAEGKGK
ncbi:MAG TPA: cupin domain-containing protein [Bryobacteraceae bacterium]|jgi:quercetin dioxygenase-like cupin family protein|nr:cupin domain-containing protein [Bryobacteraceae bacterium]